MRLGHSVYQAHCVVQGVRLGLGLYNETGEHNMYQAHCVSVPGVRLDYTRRLGNTICTRPIVLQVPGVRVGLGLHNETGEYNIYQAHCVASPRRTIRVRVVQ